MQTYLVVRGHALYVVAVWSRATYLVVRGHAPYLVAVWSCATDLVVRGAISKKQLNLFLAGHLWSKFCSEVLAQSQFATISHESCLARFGHVQKLRNIFFNQFWVKLNKNEWQGKMAMENCPWSWVPDKVEALQNGPGFFGAWMQMFDSTIFGWTYQNRFWIQRSKIVDKEHHFVGSSLWPYHFVGWRKPFCRQNVEHTTKWTTPSPPTLLQDPPWHCGREDIRCVARLHLWNLNSPPNTVW